MARLYSIQNIAKQALDAFKCVKRDSTVFHQKLGTLRARMNGLCAADVGMDGAARALATEPPTAPISYVLIAENATLIMSIFVVEAGCELPLHDHRGMHGIIKVMFGKLRMKSYDLVPDKGPTTDELDRNFIPARRKEDVELTQESDTCLLTPTEGNIHLLESIGGPAAFFDVLSPPYAPNIGHDCNYYQEMAGTFSKPGDIAWLQRIPQPASFWCDQAEYLGPHVDLDTFMK